VGQDPVLFRASLRDNLLMAAPLVSDERLQHVLRLTGMVSWVAAHPMGLDMPLGENGASLSGGQRQMVALARALLADAPVLLLDEPTSAFDAAGEQRLLEALQPELQGKTVVLATHRPGPLSLVSRLVLLDGGQMVADGPRDAVLQAVKEGRIQRAAQGVGA
jgi:ATP-binding cassette subfamily C protein LapB